LWKKDASLWTGHDEDRRLGWLEVVDQDAGTTAQLLEFQMEIGSQGLSDVLLLGMGGSSLGPEVIAQTLGSVEGFPRLHVLDSTDPAEIRSVEGKVDLERTLFIVSSKSGSTLEPNIFMDYFLARATEVVGENRAGKRFVVITDPDSHLQKIAEQKGFRQIFHGWPSIGGRYSVLSKFGIVPLAATGHDVRGFLETAAVMARACGPDVPPAHNPGVALGLVMGALARRGRDKVTIIASPSIGDFGAWAEQLIAESTGKEGKGLIPVAAEPLAEPSAYGSDRLFIHLRDLTGPDGKQDQAVEALERSGHPIVRIELAGPAMISQEFFRWEMATAVAGAVLGINPFDQPDVEASKVATQALTRAYENSGTLPAETPVFKEDGIELFADERNASALKEAGAGNTLESWLRAHFGRIRAGDYVALLAFVERNEAHAETLQDLRRLILAR